VNIFWKLFITLGVVMTLAMVAAVSMGWQIGQLTVAQFYDFDNREAIIDRAAQALNRGGRDELTTWLRQNQNPVPGMTLLVIDDNFNDLLDRGVPEVWRNAFRNPRFRPRYGAYGAEANRRDRQVTDELTGPSGEVFRFLFVQTRITLLNYLALPATQVGVVTLAVIMAAGTALLLARSLSSPIVRLQRATRSLAAGALDTRIGFPLDRRKDEVGTLARDFDAMVERIQALVTDKEVLLRDVSHELRSPLARIRVALALAERKADAASQSDLERIEQETERLDQLVGQILTLSRLRSSTLDHHVAVDMKEIITEVVADARFENPNVPIEFKAAAVPPVTGDAAELGSAVENIVRNAVLHSGATARVEIELRSRGPRIEIAIRDNGPGVPEDQLARLFEPFYRVDPSRDHKRSGYGLGLAIAASIIERHGGTIEAKNRPDGGLRVSVMLPAGRKS
jgi:signal transduction histidine kinase